MATRTIWDADQFVPGNATVPGWGEDLVSNIPRRYAALDATTDEEFYLYGVAPQGLTGTLTAVIYYKMASATSGAVRVQVSVEAVTPGDTTDLDATNSFDTANSNGGTVPGTAGYMQTISVTLTLADSMAAGDLIRLTVRRDADQTSGTDDATGDMHILSVELRDTA
jgi:hypothetical protein